MSTETRLALRVGQLEHQLQHLYRHLGLQLPDPPQGVSDEVRELVRKGNAIHAIKLHRDQTGKGLAEAKADIDALL